jgi:hypothetical protein
VNLRAVLVAANALAWTALVALREPMPEAYFAERDTARGASGFSTSSSDPFAVLAGRPLWIWSHGSEPLPVLILAIANALPLFALVVLDAFAWASGWLPTQARSVLALAVLLVLASAQWWLLGTAVMRFLAWRRVRAAA